MDQDEDLTNNLSGILIFQGNLIDRKFVLDEKAITSIRE